MTPYAPDELRSAGDVPNGDRSGVGLPAWTQANRSIENTDVVRWHTVGVTHLPRSEDWPVLPNEVAGFSPIPTTSSTDPRGEAMQIALIWPSRNLRSPGSSWG